MVTQCLKKPCACPLPAKIFPGRTLAKLIYPPDLLVVTLSLVKQNALLGGDAMQKMKMCSY